MPLKLAGIAAKIVMSHSAVTLFWWVIAAVIVGGMPICVGWIFVVLDTKPPHDANAFLARGDIFLFIVMLSAGGLATVLAAHPEKSPRLAALPLLRAILVGSEFVVCLIGMFAYALAFAADWKHDPDFQQDTVAFWSLITIAPAVVLAASCVFVSERK